MTDSQLARLFQTPCGRITLTKPADPGGYWRLEWHEDGRRRQTTGGRSEESACAKAADILARLDGLTPALSKTTVGEVMEQHLAILTATASPNHASKTEKDLRHALAPHLQLPSGELDRRRLRAACDAKPTESGARNRRSRLNALLTFGANEGYFTEPQRHLLSGYRWVEPAENPPRPTRDFLPAQHGEAERYVTDDQVPLHSALADLGDALEQFLPGRGKLTVELAHSAGYRGGELRAAEARTIDLERQHAEINWQVLDLSAKDQAKYKLTSRRARPKGNKVRTTNFPAVTATGYHLRDALGDRLEAIEWEHKRGVNPRRLLIPAARGGWMWNTSFTNDYLHRAAKEAGWEFIHWTEENGKPRKLLRHTFHTLRHRFARDRIDPMGYTVSDLQAIGGWDSAQVVWDRYYGRSRDALKVCDEKLKTWERAHRSE